MIKPKRLGHLVLRVRNIERSEKFYSKVLGLRVTARVEDFMVFFSSTEDFHDLAIAKLGDDAPGPEPGRVGLYHFAYELESLKELKEAYALLKSEGVKIAGMSEHGPTKSLYLFDPDGNEVELYAAVPAETGSDSWRSFIDSHPLEWEAAKAGG